MANSFAMSQKATLVALANFTKHAEELDYYMGHHIKRLQNFSRAIAKQMCAIGCDTAYLTPGFFESLDFAISLHDIGKAGIPDYILRKPGKLTDGEFSIMKQHCEIGATILVAIQKRFPENQFLHMGIEAAKSHHEKWDGSGYPEGLHGKNIPLVARILSIADFYDALTSNRSYRKAFDHETTCRMIENNGGNKFDPDVVSAFSVIENQLWQIRD